MVKQTLGRAIQLADQVAKALDRAVVRSTDKSSIPELKSKAEELAGLLRQLSSIGLGTYDRPVRAIIGSVEQSLDRCLFLLLKHHCPKWIIIKIIKKRFPTLIPVVWFRKTSQLLDASISEMSWLIRFRKNKTNGGFGLTLPPITSNEPMLYLNLPPITANEPMLYLVWEEIAILHDPAESYQARSSAAVSLISIVKDLDVYRKLIIRECGVEALLKLMEEGPMEAKESAAAALGVVLYSSECAGKSVDVCKVFAKILSEGFTKVQAKVAFAVSLIAERNPKWQDAFAEHDVVRLLVGHLAFETVGVHSSKTHSNDSANADEDPDTIAKIKAMAAKALFRLAEKNSGICRILADSTALYSFAVLLEKGCEDAQLDSVNALMAIKEVAEKDADLRIRCDLSPNSPTWKYVVDQLLLKITEKTENSYFQISCIHAIENLARTFGSIETRMIGPLVQLLNGREFNVTEEACIALTKLACTDNYFRIEHSKAIISAGGVKHLIQILYDKKVLDALVLICYIALHVPDSEELAQAEVLAALTWASKLSFMTVYKELDRFLCNIPLHVPDWEELYQAGVVPMLVWETSGRYLSKEDTLRTLLQEAKSRLNLHQSKGSRGVN
ncbi:hypothetical protein Pyn_20711 [Prunus yedoensis var. nudiflora]|uniref:DUF7792 domain-containing protein n=1 Tax=Prunus yedoensis var. nudiflora TaxID=2094558 RepID=A0A314YG92_PRUYE|nr:hypothetical protein Pyn_20711 [Prunus yedoensis var. nudiflora]